MLETAKTTEVTDISEVKFDILPEGTDMPENVIIPTTEVPTNETVKTGEVENKGVKTEEKKDVADVKPSTEKPTEKKSLDTPLEQEPIPLEIEDVNDILSNISAGKVTSYEELNEKLARLEEIENNPSLLFTDPNKAKLFEFLNKYQGTDYSQGIEAYAKIQQLNLESMDAETALKEVFLMKNVKMGLSQKEAEILWEDEKANKYDSRGDIGETLKKRDAIEAKQELAKMKLEITIPKVDSQQEQAVAHAKQIREDYLAQVDHSLQNEQGQFKELKLSFSDNPEEDFTFQLPDPEDVNESIRNFNQYWQDRYVDENGHYNVEQLKVDISAVKNLPIMLDQVFAHAKSIGREEAIRERTNTPSSKEKISTAANQGTGKTLADSIRELNPHLMNQ